jgi:hypothetical protein
MRDKLVGMEGRIGELGLEMARFATSVYLSLVSSQSCIHRPLDEFILRGPHTDELLNNRQVSVSHLPGALLYDV